MRPPAEAAAASSYDDVGCRMPKASHRHRLLLGSADVDADQLSEDFSSRCVCVAKKERPPIAWRPKSNERRPKSVRGTIYFARSRTLI